MIANQQVFGRSEGANLGQELLQLRIELADALVVEVDDPLFDFGPGEALLPVFELHRRVVDRTAIRIFDRGSQGVGAIRAIGRVDIHVVQIEEEGASVRPRCEQVECAAIDFRGLPRLLGP